MKKFSDFGIEPSKLSLTGDKIKLERVLGRELIVTGYSITDSKFGEPGSKCLKLQFKLGEMEYVSFTDAKDLLNTIQRIPVSELPFKTIITRRDDQKFQFT